MTAPQASTASTGGKVDPDAEHEITAIADEYNFAGVHEPVTIEIRENSDGDSVLSIYGYAPFRLSKPIYQNGEWVDEGFGYAEEFLKQIAPFLEERLVIDTIGHDGNQYPLMAHQYIVWPDGSVKHNRFERGSAITKPPDKGTSTAALTELLNGKADLTASNDLEYLLGLAGDALQNDETFADDFEQAKWAIAQWCQELQYVPDLREYTVGQTVSMDAIPEDRETAELGEANRANEQQRSSENQLS
jgi:hypothetical protein